MAAIRIAATAFVHEGAVRPTNEDTLAVGDWLRSEPMAAPETVVRVVDAPVIVLVADGMGGHAAGEVASRAVAEHLSARAAAATDAPVVARLLVDANAELFARMADTPSLGGMGTTVAGVVITPDAVIAFNVGDSRVYRIEGGALEQLSTDDTPGPKLADGRTAAATSHLITQCLGGDWPDAAPHTLTLPLAAGARYLLCTDGVTDLLDRPAMEAAIDDHDGRMVETLFEAAMARGGRDNVAIVALRIEAG
jgi:serine/threonine protein phosphatase PrpC